MDFGGGELFDGVGVGVGEVGDGLAVGLGEELDGLFEGEADGGEELGLVLAELELGDWLGVELLDVEVGLVVGLVVGLELPVLGLELAEPPEELGVLELGVELALMLLEGDAGEVRPGEEAAGELAEGISAASRAAPFGIVAHAAGTIGPLLADWAARAWPSKLEETKAKPVRTPTTAGLTTNWALTCATSLRLPRPARPVSP